MKLCGALETAHLTGTLHRDIKPANVLVNDYGEPQLTDFGTAHVAGGYETASGLFSGTVDFLAPEVMTGDPATVETDVYSLGATLYALIAGNAAYDAAAAKTSSRSTPGSKARGSRTCAPMGSPTRSVRRSKKRCGSIPPNGRRQRRSSAANCRRACAATD